MYYSILVFIIYIEYNLLTIFIQLIKYDTPNVHNHIFSRYERFHTKTVVGLLLVFTLQLVLI